MAASAADAAIPQPDDPQAPASPVETQPPDTAQAQATPEPPAEWGNWRYTGPPDRVYTNIPVTPAPGDVVTWLGPPATDGCWEPTSDEATRLPDNHPDTIAAAEAARSAETSKEG